MCFPVLYPLHREGQIAHTCRDSKFRGNISCCVYFCWGGQAFPLLLTLTPTAGKALGWAVVEGFYNFLFGNPPPPWSVVAPFLMAGNCGPVSRSDMFILGTAGLGECALGGEICIGTWGGGT